MIYLGFIGSYRHVIKFTMIDIFRVIIKINCNTITKLQDNINTNRVLQDNINTNRIDGFGGTWAKGTCYTLFLFMQFRIVVSIVATDNVALKSESVMTE